MTNCSECREEHDRPGQRYCRPCHAAYMRQWRTRHPLNDEQRVKAAARTMARTYTARGHLKQKPCRKCGDGNSQRHHPDYSRPLHVIWLCRKCHLELHAKERAKAQPG